jgi:hypothetical protein
MNEYQNSIQQLTTTAAQPLLQHNLDYFETNRGNLFSNATIAERYRGSRLTRSFREARDRMK